MRPSATPLLGRLTDGGGGTAAAWATAPLADSEYPLELVPDARGVGLATASGLARAAAAALPVWTNALDGICLTAVLAAAPDVDGVFAEVRRVLRPAGTLVVVTPSAAVRAPGQLPLRAVHRHGWPHRSALDDVGWLLAAADFAVLADDRVAFEVDVPEQDAAALAAELSAAGVWPPAVPDAVVARLAARGGRRWPVPLRRLVARR
ncbi:methyltransferase domain-containing protein [Pseudonocardia sp. CA-107938]|uniref:methyltransferase domain-containing protein n=1 Tax=Pseudonocardia sp. CA-107938 TaxID=3240021 RepID=UPI003D93A02C